MRDPTCLKALLLDGTHAIPLHSQLRAALRDLIEQEYADGELFYSEKELLEHLPISRITIRRALADLTQEGLLHRARGIGTVVTKRAPAGQVERRQPSFSTQQITQVLVPNCGSEYTAALIEKLRLASQERGMTLQVNLTGSGDLPPPFYGGPEDTAFILLPGAQGCGLRDRLEEGGYRMLAIDPPGRDYPGPSVSTDITAGIRTGLDYLQSLGHERITLLVNEPISEQSVVAKVNSFCIAMQRRMLADMARIVVCGTFPLGSSYAAAYSHLEEVWNVPPAERPTAIFTVSDPGAWAALKWLTQRGIVVPEEVSLLGSGDWAASQYMLPALSSLASPVERLAQRAIELLWDSPSGAISYELIPPTLMARQSAGRIR